MTESIIPIEHTIVDGLYTRIAYARAGLVIVGCPHKKGGTAVLLQGTIKQIDGDTKYEVSAPAIFNTKAGTQRIAMAMTDVVYSTMHSVKAKTVEEAEIELFEGTPQITRIRNSYKQLLIGQETTDDEVREDMKQLGNLVEESDIFDIRQSAIQGLGCFSKRDIKTGEVIAMTIIEGHRMATARYVNHSDIPNTQLVDYGSKGTALIAIGDILKDSELFLNYSKRK